MYYSSSPANPLFPARQREHKVKLFGEGYVLATPDKATILIGVVTESKNLQEAQQTNATKTNTVINALLENGVPRQNIQTSDYQIEIDYDFQNGVQVFRGYRITNLLQITIDNIENVGKLVDIAVENGANTVRNIQMSVSNHEELYNLALANAIKNSQEKAAIVGETLGVTINQTPFKVKEITARRPEIPRPMVLGLSTESATTPIEAGQFKITAMIEADYQFS
ncbi:SIMPL domain-containing protein [Ornithinibacillus bavariensis]|uniref:Oxidative stress defense protein n=1 Tax=Ornithinibacillus bavariensis TaxID=545502 RepID=A0A920C6J6_9BACI|nr:SIMPL domain-containing protein [Ornithinibacillus bavariensis]GIO26668.1 oxidative stress defense protein [Ornithinibacillus bavariensis]